MKIRFGSIWAQIDSDWIGFIRIVASDSFGLDQIDFLPFFIKRVIKRFSDWFRIIRIGSDTDIGMNRNSSDWLRMNSYPILSPGQLQKNFRIGSEWSPLARIQLSEWIGIVLIESEWISIRYFRQGRLIKTQRFT